MAKQFKNPTEFKRVWEDYKKSVKDKPKLKHLFVGKDGKSDYEERERPISWDGFEVYTMLMGFNESADLSEYCNEKNLSYIEYLPHSRAFKKECRADHIEGGMTGIYNPAITASLNGLKQQTESVVTTNVSILNIDPLSDAITIDNQPQKNIDSKKKD